MTVEAPVELSLYPRWRLRHTEPHSSVVDVILANRALAADDVSDSPEILHEPLLMADMERAVERLDGALRDGEKIAVFGDYDVDGITSTAVLLDYLERAGAPVDYILPHRERDGYGLKPAGVRRALERGPGLLITADNGITSFEAIAIARKAGVDVIVVDHHQPKDTLPDAFAVVNPNRTDCEYPFKGLAAVGVAFKLIQALSVLREETIERRRYLNSLLDLVALGTVADVAPMVGENRLLTRRGLGVLARSRRPGLRALQEVAGVAGRTPDATSIGYFLGPRLNSAGRLAAPDMALDLLRTTDSGEAARLAAELDALNSRRQDLQERGVNEAVEQVSEKLADDPILAVRGEEWHLGIVGLIASRLAERFARPAAVATGVRRDGTLTGSARSAAGYNLVEGLTRCSDSLTTFGGHAAAAGFSLQSDRFDEFRAQLVADGAERLSADDLVPRLTLDCRLQSGEVTLDTVERLSRLAPFGSGNEAPRFLVPDCRIGSLRTVGADGAHLKLRVDTGNGFCDAIWWRRGEVAPILGSEQRVDIAAALEVNVWNGRRSLQLRVLDLRPAGAA